MTNRSQDEFSEWKKALAELLASNQVAVAGHRYTRPAPSTYEHQWLWDSCFHAIAYRWIDPEMAWSELLSVVSHQVKEGADAGMIPHMIYWGGGGQELWLHADRSTITQPPLVGVAAWLVHAVAPNRSMLATLYPSLAAFHNWFDRRRDPDHDHLVCLIHPWEAGSDSSPRWDRAMKLPERFPPSTGTAARKTLVGILNRYGHDPLALAESGYFCVETIDFNAIRAADLEALSNIAAELGLPGDSSGWLERAKEIQLAAQTKLMQPAPHDLEGLEETPITVDSASHFIALFGGCATSDQADTIVQRMQQPDYWTAYPVPTSPVSSPSFAPQEYWRGNTWIPYNWLIYNGLRRYGHSTLASELAAKTIDLVRRAGFREYFHSITGEGLGAGAQSWTGLLIDMLAQEFNRLPTHNHPINQERSDE